jgi:hypothetical protein
MEKKERKKEKIKIKLKDYVLKTKITIGEVRERYKEGNVYHQPTKHYYVDIRDINGRVICGGLKNKKEVIKSIMENI